MEPYFFLLHNVFCSHVGYPLWKCVPHRFEIDSSQLDPSRPISMCHCPGRFLGINGQDPSVSKSNWLHVDIFRLFFIDLRYIL